MWFTYRQYGWSQCTCLVTRNRTLVCLVGGREAFNWRRSIDFFLNYSHDYDVRFRYIFIIYLNVLACYFVNMKSL